MSFFEAVISCFDNYIDGSGRAMRSEFWWWVLFTVIVNIVTSVFDALFGTGQLIGAIASLVLFVPGITVTVRRLHDVGKSGWWLLGFYGVMAAIVAVSIALMFLVSTSAIFPAIAGLLALFGYYLFLMVKRGDPGPNQYGPQP